MPTHSLHPDPEFTLEPSASEPATSAPKGPHDERQRRGPARVLLALTIVAGVAGAAYWLLAHRTTEPQSEPALTSAQPPTAPVPPATSTPVEHFPLPAPALGGPPRAPLPALDASDMVALDAIGLALRDKSLASLVTPAAIIRNIVVTIDNLPRTSAAVRLWPINPVPGVFETVAGTQGTSAAGSNGTRYAPYINAADAIESRQMVGAYVRLYPLFQQAYVELGYPNGNFNDRLIQVIDHLLAAPELSQPVELRQQKVMFEFADPELEDLSAGQKMMVRVGIANELRLKAKLRELRAALAKG